MPAVKYYSCPDCSGVFRWFHHPLSEPPPNYCPLCGSCVNADLTFVPTAPHIGKTIGRTGDAVYRQHEAASRAHLEMMADMGGGNPSDYAPPLTDMADRLRAGDMAAKIAPNPVSTFMANSGQGGFKPAGGLSGAQFAQNTGQGAFPHAGEAARRNLVAEHQTRSRAVEAFGRISRYRG